MKVMDYIINRTRDYSTEESPLYKKFFNRECDLALGMCIAGAFLYDKIFDNLNYVAMGSVLFLVTDTTVRALLGNHGEKPVSGLIGLLRDSNFKIRK
jgi:hypothetical protein